MKLIKQKVIHNSKLTGLKNKISGSSNRDQSLLEEGINWRI